MSAIASQDLPRGNTESIFSVRHPDVAQGPLGKGLLSLAQNCQRVTHPMRAHPKRSQGEFFEFFLPCFP